MIGAQGNAANVWSGQDADRKTFKMKWTVNFIDAARKSQCRIINYPDALEAVNQIIGTSDFKLKSIQLSTFEKFMPELVATQENGTVDEDAGLMTIVPWTDGTYDS